MANSDDRDHSDSRPFALGARIAGARLALWWESLWPALWPFFGCAGLWLVLALFDVLPLLPGWLHGGLLGILAAAALISLFRGLHSVRWPDEQSARRRLEQDSGLSHRPLTAFDDTVATSRSDPEGRALWSLHQRRLRETVRRLRLRPPRAGLAHRDPLALRALLVLLILVGATLAREQWPERLARAAVPQFGGDGGADVAKLDVWINPPGYTGQAPILLKTGDSGVETTSGTAISRKTPLGVPFGSHVLARVNGGGTDAPALEVGGKRHGFDRVAAEAFKIEQTIEGGERLAIVRDENVLAAWPIAVVPDTTPEIEFAGPPARTERAGLQLEYAGRDDYGIATVRAEIRRVKEPGASPLMLDIPLPAASGPEAAHRHVSGTSFFDLTAHVWAGLPVVISLIAEDARGQSGHSDDFAMVLPARTFEHPVARALVELRRRLAADPDANRFRVANALAVLNERPEHFYHDVVVALAIRSAERRLVYDATPQGIPSVQKLLWDTALRIEDGDLAIAERELREIQRKLMEALSSDASNEEIARLMDELERAMARYMEALAQEMQERLSRGEELPPVPEDAQVLEQRDLQEMMQAMRDLAQSGAREQAQDMLRQLQEMMENMQMRQLSEEQRRQQQRAQQMMRDMSEMMREQRDLLDRSFRRAQENRPGERGSRGRTGREGERSSDASRVPGDTLSDARQQEALRRALGDMMRQLADQFGEIPQPLGRAEQEMRGAEDALGRNAPSEAIGPQSRSVDLLQQGMNDMVERFMEQAGQQPGSGQGQVGWQPGRQSDPLGRRPGGEGSTAIEGVKIPDQQEMQRAREILRELRRRSGERSRPEVERNYIERLLERF